MRLYPAIDILDGNAVRLSRGDFDARKIYDEDPLSAARRWIGDGARALHVVDLDGARSGEPVNLGHLRRISGELDIPVQYGGGLRSKTAIDDALAAGAARVIIGTAAFTDPDLLHGALERHGPARVCVALDVRGGSVATAGWTETTEPSTAAVLERLHAFGVEEILYTNVDRDGMLEGPDLEEIARVTESASASIVYSGGIGALRDLEDLAGLRRANLSGVIVGKALYEERFTVGQAHEALGG